MVSLIPILTLLTLTPVWTSKDVYTTWADRGEGYIYELEVYTDKEYTQLYISTQPSEIRSIYITYYENNTYFERVKYYHRDSPEDFNYEILGQFYLNLEYGVYNESIPGFLEDSSKEYIPENLDEPIQLQKELVLTKPTDFRESISIESENQKVLGVSTQQSTSCNISVLDGLVESWECPLDIKVNSIKYQDWEQYKYLEISGTYPSTVNANIKAHECKEFNIFEPKTWFRCERVLIDTYTGSIKLIYSGNIYLDGVPQSSTNFGFMDTSFYLGKKFKEDISKKNLQISLNLYSQIKSKKWIDIQYTVKKDITFPTLQKMIVKKPFSFPIDRVIGVTQWHGCTQYQCPHKGIDFGARLNKVISIGEGTVTKVGYDRYGGECNQGGNYVIVKHTNGMYSTYFHLDSYSVKVGSKVSKGSVIGISGNSGKKNCQPLGYHLHFETRNGTSSSTHINPVEYVDVDWNTVPTIGYRQYPGRLTGDNPHPNF